MNELSTPNSLAKYLRKYATVRALAGADYQWLVNISRVLEGTPANAKLTNIFRSKWIRSMGAGMDKDVRRWLAYLNSLGCLVVHAGVDTPVVYADTDANVITNLWLDKDHLKIWNPTGDGTVIFVPASLAEKTLVFGDLP